MATKKAAKKAAKRPPKTKPAMQPGNGQAWERGAAIKCAADQSK